MDLYYNILSPSSRSVMLLGEEIGLTFNLISLDVHRKDYLNLEFKSINPQHTVPTLVDGGIAIWEPGAILIYLIEKYDTKRYLYPRDPLRRAIVNQRLFFESSTLYKAILTYYSPIVLDRKPPVEADRQKLTEAVQLLDGVLGKSRYVAGDTITIADYSLATTISMLMVLKFDLVEFKHLRRWYDLCKGSIAGYKAITQRAQTMFRNWMDSENA